MPGPRHHGTGTTSTPGPCPGAGGSRWPGATSMANPNPNAQTLASLAEQVVSGVLRVAVTATQPLEQAAEAFAAFGAGAPGKIAVSSS
ncbi:zinc-binding dehydrogenase [Streptomyces sp. NPDC005402]|uniref:zinc-binding dehydrogenase n=1 Tax=Streptomyces sp. NPDC005402 TaxID=3155338 RepID=UPI0033A544B7